MEKTKKQLLEIKKYIILVNVQLKYFRLIRDANEEHEKRDVTLKQKNYLFRKKDNIFQIYLNFKRTPPPKRLDSDINTCPPIRTNINTNEKIKIK